MIDTIKITNKLELHDSSSLTFGKNTLDKESDLRVGCSISQRTGKLGWIDWAEVSLPRLIFRDNSNLLCSQLDIEKALKRLNKLLQQVAMPIDEPYRFSRVDLTWNFEGDPQAFFLAHKKCNLAIARTRVASYRNHWKQTGITWEGKDVTVKLYDKTNEKRPLQKLTRAELQIRRRSLIDLLQQKDSGLLDFNLCYQTFRKILTDEFKPTEVPHVSAKDEVLFYAQDQGIPVLELLSGTLKESAFRRLNKKFEAYSLKHHKIDWEEILPPDGPPNAINDKGEIKVLARRKPKPTSLVKFSFEERKRSKRS